MRRKALAVLLVTIPFLPLSAVVPAQAKDQTPCSFKFDADLNPGLSNSPSSGTLTSNGEMGTVTCQGKVNGKSVIRMMVISYLTEEHHLDALFQALTAATKKIETKAASGIR